MQNLIQAMSLAPSPCSLLSVCIEPGANTVLVKLGRLRSAEAVCLLGLLHTVDNVVLVEAGKRRLAIGEASASRHLRQRG
ncbi:hypothetical protein KCV07_g277, partial [Aureobasidium melanogenum]